MKGNTRTGFSMVEVAIAVFIVGIFFLPLFQQFTAVRRFSIGAQDTVVATSLLLSRMAVLQALPPGELVSEPPSATFSAVLKMFPEKERVGNTTYETLIDIATGSDERIKILELETSFRIPGQGEGERFITLKGFAFDAD